MIFYDILNAKLKKVVREIEIKYHDFTIKNVILEFLFPVKKIKYRDFFFLYIVLSLSLPLFSLTWNEKLSFKDFSYLFDTPKN